MKTQNFWQRQKSGIYFGIFILIICSLFFWESSRTGEKSLTLVNFTLELIEKMQSQNNKIIEISQKMELREENYQILIEKINEEDLLQEKIEILWPPSDFAQNAKIFQNMGAKLVENNQQNWQKIVIPELLENQKTVLDEINYSSLTNNLKEQNLEKSKNSLISGQKYLENRLERAKKIINLDKQIPLVNQIEKSQETLEKIDQILKQNTAQLDQNTELEEQNWQEINQIITQPIKIEKSIEIKIDQIQTKEFLENLEQIKKSARNFVKK